MPFIISSSLTVSLYVDRKHHIAIGSSHLPPSDPTHRPPVRLHPDLVVHNLGQLDNVCRSVTPIETLRAAVEALLHV